MVEPPFNGSPDGYERYEARHAKDGIEGRVVSMYTFKTSCAAWKMHPPGSEVVLCSGRGMALHQAHADRTRSSDSLGPP
jgi:hypothetical protein